MCIEKNLYNELPFSWFSTGSAGSICSIIYLKIWTMPLIIEKLGNRCVFASWCGHSKNLVHRSWNNGRYQNTVFCLMAAMAPAKDLDCVEYFCGCESVVKGFSWNLTFSLGVVLRHGPRT